MRAEKDRSAKLMSLFNIVVSKLSNIEKLPRDFGTGDKLFTSEIHVIDAIGRNPGINMTKLSAILGISKPAATKLVSKVIRRKLIERYNKEGNLKEVLLKLTASGGVVFRGHQEFHSRLNADIVNRLEQLSTQESATFLKLLGKMALYLDGMLTERNPRISLDRSNDSRRGRAQ
jgi:DNA-binding MarR family transcriptional regulator